MIISNLIQLWKTLGQVDKDFFPLQVDLKAYGLGEGHKNFSLSFRDNQKIIIFYAQQIFNASDFFSIFFDNRTPDYLEKIVFTFF